MPPRRSAKAAAPGRTAPSQIAPDPPPGLKGSIPSSSNPRSSNNPTRHASSAQSGADGSAARPPPVHNRAHATLDAYPAIPLGGKAAREVYNTLELRQAIFEHVDHHTLAGMMRLEKGVVSSVARVLYRTILASQVGELDRTNVRRAAYCDAVRHLDLNPLPPAENQPVFSSRFNPNLLKNLPSLRQKLPHLQTILRDRPLSSFPKDEAFIIHLSGDKVILDIETKHHIKIYPFPDDGTPILPSAPQYDGVEVNHTISLTLSGGYTAGELNWGMDMYNPSVPDPTLDSWRAWLFSDPNRDARISSVQLSKTMIEPTVDEIIAFASQHGRERPYTFSLHIPRVHGMTATQLRHIVAPLGAGLRALHLISETSVPVIDGWSDRSPTEMILDDWPSAITLLDNILPNLQYLHIYHGVHSIPLSSRPAGLSNLKEFHFRGSGDDLLALAQAVYQLGSRDCVFHPSALVHDRKSQDFFNQLVCKLKTVIPKYNPLRTLTASDLDLYDSKEIAAYPFQPVNGRFRRIALDTIMKNGVRLSKAQAKIEPVVARQTATCLAVREAMARSIQGINTSNGDAKAENELIRREFETVVQQQVELGALCGGAGQCGRCRSEEQGDAGVAAVHTTSGSGSGLLAAACWSAGPKAVTADASPLNNGDNTFLVDSNYLRYPLSNLVLLSCPLHIAIHHASETLRQSGSGQTHRSDSRIRLLRRRAGSPPKRAKASSSKAKAKIPSRKARDVSSDCEVAQDVEADASLPPKPQRNKAGSSDCLAERGGKAASEVYNTLELRRHILGYLGHGTLAVMLRLEKAVTASVSERLYETVHVSQLNSMSRATPRRAVYCDAVRVLDINPLPFADTKPHKANPISDSPFHPSVLKDLPAWRKKLPQLHTIIRDRPPLPLDDHFSVHLAGEKVVVRLETQHDLEMSLYPTKGPPVLPASPRYAGLDVHHTIALTFNSGYGFARIARIPAELDPNLISWRNWLFCDPALDARVSVIYTEETAIKLSVDEVIDFITHRKQSGELRRFVVPPVEALSLDQLQRIVGQLGPALRSLHLSTSTIAATNDWPTVIGLLDATFPQLQELVVSDRNEVRSVKSNLLSMPSSPLAGLPHLRIFRFRTSRSSNEDFLALAQHVHRVGSPHCLFYGSEHTVKTQIAFNDLISKLRSSLPKYASLHNITARDLDLFTAADIASYPFQPSGGRFRRLALDTTSNHQAAVAKVQDKLDGLITRQKDAATTFQQALARTTNGINSSNGNTKAENELIKREFERVLKEQVELGKACAAMTKMVAEVDAKSRNMLVYAQTWLASQGKGA